MIFLKLFWSFFQVGLFSIGGGMASIPLIQNQVVDINGWLTQTQFADLIVISEMTPGPIAINSATFVGIQIAGPLGAVAATLGSITPSCIIVSILAMIYNKYKDMNIIQGVLGGLRPAVVALIASAGLSILIMAFWGEGGFSTDIRSLNVISVVLFAASLFALRKWKPNPVYVILLSGAVGAAAYLLL